ncbi:MAG: hypothetical protein ACREBG_12605 [Pyrinomonadaceae bacterium]
MRRVSILVAATLTGLLLLLNFANATQESPKLWAAISVSSSVFKEGSTKNLQLDFTLVNDGAQTINPRIESSKIFINGKELEDSSLIFANGPRGVDWSAIPPGGFLQFSYGLEKYFRASGIYKVSWKGEEFESPPIVFRVLPGSPSSFASFKRDLASQVGKKITVTGVLQSAKLGWLVAFKDWGVYVYTVKDSDTKIMNGLGRYAGHTVKVTGTLQYFPEQPSSRSDSPVAVPPEHFFFDVAEVKIVSLSPPPTKPN